VCFTLNYDTMAKRRQSSEESNTPKLSITQQRNELSFLLSFYSTDKSKAIVALIVVMLSSSISLAFPALTGKLIDTVIIEALTKYMVETALVLGGLFFLQAVLQYFSSVTLSSVTENALARLRGTLYRHILSLPMSFFDKYRIGDVISRMTNDVTQIQETFTFTFLQLLRQSVFLIGGVIFILARSVQLTLPVLGIMPILIIVAIVFGRKLRAISKQAQEKAGVASTIVEETLQAVQSVKLFTNENYEVERYSTTLTEFVRLAIKSAKLRSVFISFILFAMFGGIAGVLTYGGYLYGQGIISLGDLTSFLMYAMFVAGALGSFAELFGQIQRTLGTAMRIREVLNELPEESTLESDSKRLHSVQLSNIKFSYPSRNDVEVLKGISLNIEQGKRIAFVGESGSGKSTTASIIQGLYNDWTGRLTYDGIPAKELSLNSIRGSIGIVPQDIVLFGGTIEDNIRYGKLSATEEEIAHAVESANALEFINSFPDGMKTLVGERGIKLSGGQRQRIAIARAILKNPSILILDEATSSLDSQTEYLIQEALERLMENRTTIVIAHRLSTIRKCDVIYVYSKGEIIEYGTHDELIKNPTSMYTRLCELQFGLTT
jgi:ABC-type multidrug transport system fused ATPase/permease subunit